MASLGRVISIHRTKELQMTTEYKDMMDSPLKVGDYVVTSDRSYVGLKLGRVEGFTPLKVKLKMFTGYRHNMTVGPDTVCKVGGEDVLAFVLKKGFS